VAYAEPATDGKAVTRPPSLPGQVVVAGERHELDHGAILHDEGHREPRRRLKRLQDHVFTDQRLLHVIDAVGDVGHVSQRALDRAVGLREPQHPQEALAGNEKHSRESESLVARINTEQRGLWATRDCRRVNYD
jgi:hypothetical protein